MRRHEWTVLAWAMMLGTLAADDPTAPPDGYQLSRDADKTFVSPDGAWRGEQYWFDPGEHLLWQTWIFDSAQANGYLLNPGETDESQLFAADARLFGWAEYPARYRFAPNQKYLVRVQKLAAEIETVFVYDLQGARYQPDDTKPTGLRAWDYFLALPENAAFHPSAAPSVELIDGLHDNYASFGEHWPDSRYLLLSLSCAPGLKGWRCVYDLQSHAFTVPPDIKAGNARALAQAAQVSPAPTFTPP